MEPFLRSLISLFLSGRTHRSSELAPLKEPFLCSLISLFLSGWRRTGELPASSPVIQDKSKLLHLFVPEDQLSDHCKLMDTLAGKNQTVLVPVPGSKKEESFVTSSDICRISSNELIKLVFFFHSLGWCFGGSISEEDLLLPCSGSMRISLSKWYVLEVLSDDGQTKDVASVAKIIRHRIFSTTTVLPENIEHLLGLLENFKPRLAVAVLQHPALQKELDALAQFEQLYNEFLQTRLTDPAKHERIIAAMPYCDFSELHWKFKARANIYLEEVLTHEQRKNKKVADVSMENYGQIHRALEADPSLRQHMNDERYNIYTNVTKRLTPELMATLPDPGTDRAVFFKIVLDDLGFPYGDGGDFLLSNIRNNNQHLVEDHSVPKDPPYEILFKYYQVMHIFGRYYPLFFCDFYLTMYEERLVQDSRDRTLSHLMKQPE